MSVPYFFSENDFLL